MSEFPQSPEDVAKQIDTKFTDQEVRELGDAIGIDWDKIDAGQFKMGLGVEIEHSETVGGDMKTVAKIAADHLGELPDYYSRLEKMEREAD